MTEKVFETFLRRIERTPEGRLRELLEKKGYKYVDTPGMYHSEAKQYHGDIRSFFMQNAGETTYNFYYHIYTIYGMKFFK